MIPEELKVRINQIYDLDRRRNRSGVPMDVYRDMSGIIADEAITVISDLSKLVENK